MPARVISTAFALGAFAIAVVAGLLAGNPTSMILINAIIAMVACNVIGLMIGAIMEHTINEHLKDYRAARPVPELESSPARRESTVEEGVDNSGGG